MTETTASLDRHWVMIRVFSGAYTTSNLLMYLKWEHLPFHTRCRFDWYFKYRHALLQVRYPKQLVELTFGIEKKTPEQILSDKKKYAAIALKSKITKLKNSIDQIDLIIHNAEINWSELFPITDYPEYISLKQKRESYADQLQRISAQLADRNSATNNETR
ncbi:hypothetical protein [Nodularia spumigena]|jgi:hypothetical protein|uniref:hypothetical protein n=1 Tax=Nodularia spumigena TaxID=70799 RepID=UPI00232EB9CA|nr:hypothetical protein [Nodularia spumigena]MDB9500046.1 hypothetical protein [Nodularia spumigena CS-336/02]